MIQYQTHISKKWDIHLQLIAKKFNVDWVDRYHIVPCIANFILRVSSISENTPNLNKITLFHV